MGRPRPDFSGRGVALRKESVDRNDEYAVLQNIVSTVALRKESVDRNCRDGTTSAVSGSRSPQGERG